MIKTILVPIIIITRKIRRALNLPVADLSKRTGSISAAVRVAEDVIKPKE